jgi:hypothetical protein
MKTSFIKSSTVEEKFVIKHILTLITWWGESTQGRYEDSQEITPPKKDSIWCPQCKGTNAETLKQQRPIGEGDQELEKRLVWEELI